MRNEWTKRDALYECKYPVCEHKKSNKKLWRSKERISKRRKNKKLKQVHNEIIVCAVALTMTALGNVMCA